METNYHRPLINLIDRNYIDLEYESDSEFISAGIELRTEDLHNLAPHDSTMQTLLPPEKPLESA